MVPEGLADQPAVVSSPPGLSRLRASARVVVNRPLEVALPGAHARPHPQGDESAGVELDRAAQVGEGAGDVVARRAHVKGARAVKARVELG
ncbi:MAG: hypothetical protein KIT58_01140 [Planctomycetota bacterium]|nr:hypothetical protein [Planctomycetota bacterium]